MNKKKNALLRSTLTVVILCILLIISGYITTMIPTKAFIRYLWWKLTSETSVTTSSTISHGSSIHYTVYGKGKPLLMLHGGLSNKLCWFAQIPQLSRQNFQLILLDSRGHGKSELGTTELNFQTMSADATAVLNHLKIDRADILGWSDGANTALQMAILNPERVKRIIAISGNYNSKGLTMEAQEENKTRITGLHSLLYSWWTGAGKQFSQLESRLKLLWNSGPILTKKELEQIKSPVLLIFGEHDVIKIGHAKSMDQLIPGSRLYIVKGGGHSTLFTDAVEVNKQIELFLNKK